MTTNPAASRRSVHRGFTLTELLVAWSRRNVDGVGQWQVKQRSACVSRC